MTCTLKDHYLKAHGMQLTTAELNKICVKLPPGPINPPLSPNSQQPMVVIHDETQIIQQQQQDTSNISMISIPGIHENVVESTIITTIGSPVNLAK